MFLPGLGSVFDMEGAVKFLRIPGVRGVEGPLIFPSPPARNREIGLQTVFVHRANVSRIHP